MKKERLKDVEPIRPPESCAADDSDTRMGRVSRFLPATALFFLLFFPVIFFGRQFCFRDAGDYYYPLFRQVQEELNAGRLPLWDMYDNFGQPLMANPTVSVYYPGKLIFFLTALFPVGYGFCYKWYILLHFPLAFLGMYRLSRHWRLSLPGAALAALCYTFSGPIFFQYCNVIFLIGAAWLPWGLEQGDRLLRTGKTGHLLKLAAVLFLMISGGDAQAAYLTGLLCFTLWGYYYLLERKERRAVQESAPEKKNRKNGRGERKKARPPLVFLKDAFSLFWRGRLGRLICAGLLGGLLSAAMILPAQIMSARTNRALLSAPSSLWQIPRFLVQSRSQKMGDNLSNNVSIMFGEGKSTGTLIREGVFAKEQVKGMHSSAIYMRSLMPLRTAEFLWPSFSGDPMWHSRWWSAPLCRYLFWSPTIYFGILPALLALSALRFRSRGDTSLRMRVRVWASWTALIFLLASFGTYGPAWFARTISSCLIAPRPLEYGPYEPVGGIYWLMTVFLPMFASFRYPEKLMTVVIFAAALLAGLEFDRVLESKRFRRLALATAVLSLCLCGAVALFGIERLLPDCFNPPRTYPLDGPAMNRLLCLTFLQPAVLLTFYFGLFSVMKRRGVSMSHPVFLLIALALLAVDLKFALRAQLPTVSENLLSAATPLAERFDAARSGLPVEKGVEEAVATPSRFYALYSRMPPKGMMNRLGSGLTQWCKLGLSPKHSASERIATLPTMLTMEPSDPLILCSLLFGECINQDNLSEDYFTKLIKRYDIDFIGLPEKLDGSALRLEPLDPSWTETTPPPIPDGDENFAETPVFSSARPYGYAYWKSTVPSSRLRIVRRLNNAVGAPGADSASAAEPDWRTSEALDGETVRLTRYEASRIEFDATLQEPGAVLLADQYWPGWRAVCRRIDKPDEPPLTPEIQYDIGLRRIELPAGQWRVEMVYRPSEIWIGMALSLVGWLLWIGIAVRSARCRKDVADVAGAPG